MALDTLRTRFLYKSLDAVMTAPLRSRKRRSGYLKSILSLRSSQYDRVAALVGFVDTLMPGLERRAAESLLRSGSLPFPIEQLELLASGSGSTVFLLEPERSRKVLKVYRRTIGQSRGRLLDLARVYKKKYETVSSWYAGPYDIVVPASFLTLHAPLLGRSAVGCLQSYIGGDKQDFFTDSDDSELLRLMKEDRGFREQFTFFARQTLKVREEQRLCADLLGAQNLMILREGACRALKLIDYGVFDLGSLENKSPVVFSRLSSLFFRLESLLRAVSRDR